MKFGFFTTLEQHPQTKLFKDGLLAEIHGFDQIMVDDHFHPWWDTDAYCAFPWTWMALMLDKLKSIPVGTGVTCPILRYNPAIVAQAFASLGDLFPGRVFLGIGAGEAMNEVPIGYEWPTPKERVERTEEAIQVITRLWNENFVNFDGKYYTLKQAKLYTKPKIPIPIWVAVMGPKISEMAGKYADGIISFPLPIEHHKKIILPSLEKGARSVGKDSNNLEKHMFYPISYDEDYDKAMQSIKCWSGIIPWADAVNIPDPRNIELLAKEKVGDKGLKETKLFSISNDIDEHIKRIEPYIKLGYNITFLSSSPNQEKFIKVFGKKVLPYFREQYSTK